MVLGWLVDFVGVLGVFEGATVLVFLGLWLIVRLLCLCLTVVLGVGYCGLVGYVVFLLLGVWVWAWPLLDASGCYGGTIAALGW